MSYLFLSFTDRLDKGSNFKSELYNQSLNEQYKQLQKRIPLNRQVGSFKQFIEYCFPTGMTKRYYIACPNFLREKESSKSGKVQYLDNVVVRPELTLSMRGYLPDNQNIILIGKIIEDDGVSCFYLNDDDLEGHRRVIEFFIKNDLIRKSKKGKLYNICSHAAFLNPGQKFMN